MVAGCAHVRVRLWTVSPRAETDDPAEVRGLRMFRDDPSRARSSMLRS